MNDMTKSEGLMTDWPAMCPASSRSEKKLKQILDGARAVFREQGFAGASVDDIAKSAGISKATMYRYFPDKASIYEAVMKGDCKLQAELAETCIEGLPIREKLLKHAVHHIHMFLSPFIRDIYRAAVAESARMPEIGQQFFSSGPEKRKAMLSPILAEASRKGDLAVEDADFAAFQFFALCAAEIQMKALFGVKQDYTDHEIGEYAARAVDTFMRAYAPCPEQQGAA